MARLEKQNGEVLQAISKLQKTLGELSKTTWQVATSSYKVGRSLLQCLVIVIALYCTLFMQESLQQQLAKAFCSSLTRELSNDDLKVCHS